MWWGGVRINGTDDFVWYTTREPVYGTWHPGEPNGLLQGEDCMLMVANANTYGDAPCSAPFAFVCEFPDQNVTLYKDEL